MYAEDQFHTPLMATNKYTKSFIEVTEQEALGGSARPSTDQSTKVHKKVSRSQNTKVCIHVAEDGQERMITVLYPYVQAVVEMGIVLLQTDVHATKVIMDINVNTRPVEESLPLKTFLKEYI